MEAIKVKKGLRVVRSKGDYVVGRTGLVLEVDLEKNRANVDWDSCGKSWVSFLSIEDESEPYEIIPAKEWKDNKGYYKFSNPKYLKK